MSKINIEEYKKHLINYYRYEYDNAENQRKKRMLLLANKYSDEFLEKIILGTYNFVNKIIELSNENYCGYLKLPLETEPNLSYIDLELIGGWKSDTIVSYSGSYIYSIGLLKRIFGDFFYIEPCLTEFSEEVEDCDDLLIVSEIPSYYLYIQCKKEIIDGVTISNNTKVRKKDYKFIY